MNLSSRRISYLAAGLAGLLLLVLIAAYLTLRSMDLNSMRPEIITQVRQLTGRDLRFEGDLAIGLQNGLAIQAKGLALSNAAWGSRPWMLKLGDVTAHLALLPLLRGEIRIKRIDLKDIDLLLETDPAGEHNWGFVLPTGGSGKAVTEIPSISVESGQVTWRTPGKQGTEDRVLEQLQLTMDVDEETLHIEADARLQGEHLELNGRLPTPSALARGRSIESDLQLRIAGMSLQADGTLQLAAWGVEPNLQVQAKQLDLATTGRLTGRSLPALPLIDTAFRLEREAKVWKVTELDVGSGRSRLQGQLQLETGGKLPRLSGRVWSERLDLNELLPASATQGRDGAGSPAGAGPWLWLQALAWLDADLQMRLARLSAWDIEYQQVQIDVRLEQGHLMLQPVKADLVGGGNLTARLEVDGAGEQPQWVLAYASSKTPAGFLLGPKSASLVKAPVDLVLELRTAGNDVQSMTRNLAGVVRLVVGKGTARIKRLDTLVGGLTTLTGQLLSRGSENAQLNCAVGDFKLNRGVATTQVLLIDSRVSTVRGDGRIDLGAQRIDLTFTPQPKTPTLTVAVPVHVRGPLRNPQFSKDTKATLGRLLGIAGIFVYPPAAVVALGELGGQGNPCIGLMRGETSGHKGKPEQAKKPSVSSEPLKSLGRGLKKLFGQ